jgi:hypothetical protein
MTSSDSPSRFGSRRNPLLTLMLLFGLWMIMADWSPVEAQITILWPAPGQIFCSQTVNVTNSDSSSYWYLECFATVSPDPNGSGTNYFALDYDDGDISYWSGQVGGLGQGWSTITVQDNDGGIKSVKVLSTGGYVATMSTSNGGKLTCSGDGYCGVYLIFQYCCLPNNTDSYQYSETTSTTTSPNGCLSVTDITDPTPTGIGTQSGGCITDGTTNNSGGGTDHSSFTCPVPLNSGVTSTSGVNTCVVTISHYTTIKDVTSGAIVYFGLDDTRTWTYVDMNNTLTSQTVVVSGKSVQSSFGTSCPP